MCEKASDNSTERGVSSVSARSVDTHSIVILRKSLRARLWIGSASVAALVAIVLVANVVRAPQRSPALDRVGHDFLPFYAAGSLLRDGRPAREMYDVEALRTREREIAASEHLALGDGFGPFWNPPFYALPFEPLSRMPFRAALLAWTLLNLAALVASIVLLARFVVGSSDWKTWGLLPVLLLASTPFILALTHGQNTFCSLFLLTLATLTWRRKRALTAGLLIGFLSYKPQLAALVGVIAFIDLGWRVIAGAAVSAGSLAGIASLAMPGVFADYRLALPKLLHFMQVEHVYMWERHVTLKAFWRLLLQGPAAGETRGVVIALTVLTALPIATALIVAALRRVPSRREDLIAATIAAMPLLMPFYFDYDLLLLAIPAALLAGMRARGRTLMASWCALYLVLIVNPDVAEKTGVNVAVPILFALAATLAHRALRRDVQNAQCEDTDVSFEPGRSRLAA